MSDLLELADGISNFTELIDIGNLGVLFKGQYGLSRLEILSDGDTYKIVAVQRQTDAKQICSSTDLSAAIEYAVNDLPGCMRNFVEQVNSIETGKEQEAARSKPL